MQPHNQLRSSLDRKGQGPSGRRNLLPAMGLGMLEAPMLQSGGAGNSGCGLHADTQRVSRKGEFGCALWAGLLPVLQR